MSFLECDISPSHTHYAFLPQLQGSLDHVKTLSGRSDAAHTAAMAQLQEELARLTERALKSEHELQLLRTNKYASDNDKQRQLREKEDVSRRTQEEMVRLREALAHETRMRAEAEKDRGDTLQKCQQLQKAMTELQIEAAAAREMSKAAREREELVVRELDEHRAIARDAHTALHKTNQEESWLRSALEIKNRELQALRMQLDAAMGNHSTATRSLVQAQAQNMLDMHELSSLRPLRAMVEQAARRAQEAERALVEERARMEMLRAEFLRSEEDRKRLREELMGLRLKYQAQIAIRDEYQAKMRGDGQEKLPEKRVEEAPTQTGGLLSGMGYYDILDQIDALAGDADDTAVLPGDEWSAMDAASPPDQPTEAPRANSLEPVLQQNKVPRAPEATPTAPTALPATFSHVSLIQSPTPISRGPSVQDLAPLSLTPLTTDRNAQTATAQSGETTISANDDAAASARRKKMLLQDTRASFGKRQSQTHRRRSTHGSLSNLHSSSPVSPLPQGPGSPPGPFTKSPPLSRRGSAIRPTSATGNTRK